MQELIEQIFKKANKENGVSISTWHFEGGHYNLNLELVAQLLSISITEKDTNLLSDFLTYDRIVSTYKQRKFERDEYVPGINPEKFIDFYEKKPSVFKYLEKSDVEEFEKIYTKAKKYQKDTLVIKDFWGKKLQIPSEPYNFLEDNYPQINPEDKLYIKGRVVNHEYGITILAKNLWKYHYVSALVEADLTWEKKTKKTKK